ncbi:MAG TPA: nucleotide exchange factor GrpE [Rhodoglobus sp.]|jgi:molecular chaperone GrpE|nr:nucleotide exchange factor GrpE [Actinomycetota bacterium]HOI03380.1 nucleotide exchange factor GrpE [Dermatophilaceae bacterium]HOT33045.1 nucleotide exchange factor GrpE [Rhodoglobus sp.]HOW01497.1 nucleotide exchange factor GrpE [Rhodoglobus sp.]HPM50807.1 nucleotide exchange factor GrpE [Rhodoglobus sp.]
MSDNNDERHENEEPVIRDKRRIDPETGDVREPDAAAVGDDTPAAEAVDADGADAAEELSDADQALLDQAAQDLVAEMRSDMLRAQAELVNFRTRVERDRAANREAVIAEVIRSLLPALDDLARAEAHGDLIEGAPLTIIAQKLRGAFEKYGLRQIGEKGEAFDPAFHEAVVQLPSPDVTVNTIADVIEPGYVLGDRLVRPAKVAVSVPAE